MHTLYLGPSWAVQSFESWDGKEDLICTNLAQELKLTNYTQLAHYGDSNITQLNKAINFIDQHPELAPFRIVFVIGTTLDDGHLLEGVSREFFAINFLKSNDPIGIIHDLEQKFYCKLSGLNVQIALIGSHTDVVDFNFSDHITVIHPSWQNFLGTQCGIEPFFGWPAEVGNKWITGRLDWEIQIPQVNPSHQTVFEIDYLLSHWSTLAQNKLWCGVHPNILANQLFAKQINNTFNQWIDNTI